MINEIAKVGAVFFRQRTVVMPGHEGAEQVGHADVSVPGIEIGGFFGDGLDFGYLVTDRFGQRAELLGLETAVVTVAPPDAPELGVLRGVKNLSLHAVPGAVMTTFGHEHVGGRRKLSLLACARPLLWQDIPVGWQSPDVVYAGPVAGECDAALLGHFESAYGIACIQGWLREVRSGAPVRPDDLLHADLAPFDVRFLRVAAPGEQVAIPRNLCQSTG
jgi:hypothetical protein